MREVEQLNARLEGRCGSEGEGEGVDDSEISEAVQVFRLRPHRMELLVSGEIIWERFEWRRLTPAGEEVESDWGKPRRLLPY